jgi:hypothetical protein
LHYGVLYQQVPAGHAGDLGIEGFSRSDGTAFQCYAVSEPVTIKERYEKQRDKITTDLNKFKSKQKELTKLFGNTPIRIWALVVPRFDSAKLVQHASEKAEEIRALNLPYVSADFQVQVIKDDTFEAEKATLLEQGLAHIEIPAVKIKTGQVGNWTKSNDELVNRMDGKLKKMPTAGSPATLQSLRDQLLTHYLASENILARLKSDYPFWYEKLSECKQHRERFLATDSLIKNLPLLQVIQDYSLEIKEKVKAIDSDCADVLGYGTATDWLLRCPLDFPEVKNG